MNLSQSSYFCAPRRSAVGRATSRRPILKIIGGSSGDAITHRHVKIAALVIYLSIEEKTVNSFGCIDFNANDGLTFDDRIKRFQQLKVVIIFQLH